MPKTVHSTLLKFLISLWFVGLLITEPVFAFSITEPSKTATLKSGQQINVHVDLGDIGDIMHSKFFWYGEQEDMLEEFVDEKLALVATSSNTPPYGGPLRVPNTAIGNLRLLAIAEKEGGSFASEREQWAIFDEHILKIEPASELQEIDFETEKPLGFGRAGSAAVYDQVDFLGKGRRTPSRRDFRRWSHTGYSTSSNWDDLFVIGREGRHR